MDESNRFVVFVLDEQQFALYLSSVQRIARIVEITPLPKAPEIVLGVVNVKGSILPVVDIRKRFLLPGRDAQLSDHLIIGCTAKRSIALLVDDVIDILEIPEQKIIKQGHILPSAEYIDGAVKLEGNIVLIHDLDKFLSLEEEHTLDAALQNAMQKETEPEKRKRKRATK